MANKLTDNKKACVCPEYRKQNSKNDSCCECYWAQVKNGKWQGTNKCFNSGCIELAK